MRRGFIHYRGLNDRPTGYRLCIWAPCHAFLTAQWAASNYGTNYNGFYQIHGTITTASAIEPPSVFLSDGRTVRDAITFVKRSLIV